MYELKDYQVQCPYCGEMIDVLIDTSVEQQTYIEDCQVCCHPINFSVTVGFEGELQVEVTSDN